MTVSLSGLDKEIQQLEQRIADDRAAFVSALGDCGQSARKTASSPKALLAVAAVGFVAGKLLFRRPAPPKPQDAAKQAKAGGALGLLAAGLSLMQPGYGASGIARWAAQQFWERRQKNRQPGARAARPATVPRGARTGEMPEVRMPPRREQPAKSAAGAVR